MKSCMFLAMTFIVASLFGQIGGVYTVGGSTADYPNLQDALDEITDYNVTSDVVFNINPGVYDGAFFITTYQDIYQSYNVRLTSATGAPEDVVLTNSTATSEQNYIMHLDKVDNVTLEGITFTASSATSYNRCLYITETTQNGVVTNCVFNGVNDTDNDNGDLLHIENILYLSHHNFEISNNNFYGGDTHINVAAASYNPHYNDFSIYSNYHDVGYRAAYIRRSLDLDMHNNNCTGVYQGYQVVDAVRPHIYNNRMFSGYYGIQLTDYSDGVSGSLIYNNVIHVSGQNWNTTNYIVESKGISVENCDNVHVMHNTVLNTSQDDTSRAGHITGTDVYVENNIFVSTVGGYGMLVTNFNLNGNHPNLVRSNVIYSRQANIVRFGGGYNDYYQELNDFNVAHGLYNISVNPLFDDDDLHTSSPWLDNRGNYNATTYVGHDINGNVRSTITPDLGAYEYTSDPTLDPLAGWYTVGQGGDFATMTDVAHDLTYRGVSDAVYITLTDSVYYEQFILERIPGVAYNRPVVFFGEDNIIRYSDQTSTDNYAMKLTRLKYVLFNDITFETENTSYGNLAYLYGYNRAIDFSGCTFNAPPTGGSSNNKYSIGCEYYSDIAGIDVEECTFNGNAYGVNLRGRFMGIVDNQFSGHYRGMELTYADTSLVMNNDITECSYLGINITQSIAVQVLNNRIDVSGRGMDVSNISMDESLTRTLIANNTIHSSNSYGLNAAGDGVNIINNTVMVEGDNHYALYFYHFPSHCDVVNNVLVSLDDRAVDCYYYTPSDDKVMDYNCLYSEANDLARLQTLYYDIDDLQASNPDCHQHSIPWNPLLTADMHSTSPYLRQAGMMRTEINDDMDGDLRIGAFDMGADQQTSTYTGSPMAGMYTVGDVSSDFLDLQDAIDALEYHGAGGDVTFALHPGSYAGFYTIRSYPRPSDLVKLLIAGNVATTIDVEPVGNQPGDNFGFYLLGADNVRLYGLNFLPVNSTQRINFIYSNGKCDNISIENCSFDLGTTYHYGYNGGDTVGDDLLITGCTFTGTGEGGIFIDGEYYNNKRNDGVIVSQCIFTDVSKPVSISKTDNLKVHHCQMNHFTCALALGYVGGETDIHNNTMYGSGFTGSYSQHIGVSLYNTGETPGDDVMLQNNIIYITGSSAQSVTGLHVQECQRMGLNHNTVIVDNDTYYEYGGAFSMSNCDTLYVMNNIFSTPINGYAVRSSANDGCLWLSNAYYAGAEELGWVNGEVYSPNDFIYGQLEDFGGAYANPLPDSLGHATTSYLRGIGVLTSLAEDINGNAWGAEPDPGATVIPDLGDVVYTSQIVGQGGLYADLDTCVQDLMRRGIAGDITLYLAPGTYPAQEIGFIPNSLTGSVTIQAQTGQDVIIQSDATGDADNWGIKLFNVYNLTLKDLDFVPLNESQARGVVLDRYNKGICVDGCTFSTSQTNPTSSSLTPLYAYFTPFDDITMQNCTVDNMGYGVFLNGFTSNAVNTGVHLLHNTMNNLYQAVHIVNTVQPTVNGNTLTNCSGTAVRIEDSSEVTLSNNYIEGHGSYGVELDDIADDGAEQWLFNNYVEMTGTTNGAIRISDTPHARLLHNTLRIASTYYNSRGFYHWYGSPDLVWVNNIVQGGEIAPVVLESMDDVTQIGYNLTYTPDAPYLRLDDLDVTTISDYQTITGDVTTLLMAADLGEGYHTLAGSNAIDSGTPYTGMDWDIEGNPRTTPDRGCWEYHILGLDTPQNLRIACAGGQVTLLWDAVTGAATYNVYAASSASLPFEQWTLVGSGIAGTSWSGAATATRGYYRVCATDTPADARTRTRTVR